MKTCRDCLEEKPREEFYKNRSRPDGYHTRCKLCDHKHSNKRLAGSYKLKNPQKLHARNILKAAIKRGDVVRGDCVVCGEPEAHGHHTDYSRALDVVWLCREHHQEEHNKKTAN